MILQYFPPNRIVIDEIIIEFYEGRQSVRARLAKEHEEENWIMPMRGNVTEPIYMRRDIYKGITAAQTFFFLDYDMNDLLAEVEVHQCERIEVLGIPFDFDDELDSIGLKLSEYSEVSILSEGEIFFKDLKMAISDKRKMGGEGNTLAYFYCASDVSHLG